MARELPELRVVENHLPRHHPGSQFRAGYVLRPRDSERGSDSDLATLYAPLILDGDENTGDVAAAVDSDLPLVRANFITSLDGSVTGRSEEHTSELQSRGHLVCRLLLEKKK